MHIEGDHFENEVFCENKTEFPHVLEVPREYHFQYGDSSELYTITRFRGIQRNTCITCRHKHELFGTILSLLSSGMILPLPAAEKKNRRQYWHRGSKFRVREYD